MFHFSLGMFGVLLLFPINEALFNTYLNDVEWLETNGVLLIDGLKCAGLEIIIENVDLNFGSSKHGNTFRACSSSICAIKSENFYYYFESVYSNFSLACVAASHLYIYSNKKRKNSIEFSLFFSHLITQTLKDLSFH